MLNRKKRFRDQLSMSLFLMRAAYGLLAMYTVIAGVFLSDSALSQLVTQGLVVKVSLKVLFVSSVIFLLDVVIGTYNILGRHRRIMEKLCALGNKLRPWGYAPSVVCYLGLCYQVIDNRLNILGWQELSIFTGILSVIGAIFWYHESVVVNQANRHKDDVCCID